MKPDLQRPKYAYWPSARRQWPTNMRPTGSERSAATTASGQETPTSIARTALYASRPGRIPTVQSFQKMSPATTMTTLPPRHPSCFSRSKRAPRVTGGDVGRAQALIHELEDSGYPFARHVERLDDLVDAEIHNGASGPVE